MREIVNNKNFVRSTLHWIRETYKAYLSTPWWAYMLLVISIVVLAIFYKEGFHFHFSENLMYGIAGSLVVSVLIDLGNTRRSKQEAKEQFIVLTGRLKRQCFLLAPNLLKVFDDFGLSLGSRLKESENEFFKMTETIPMAISEISKHKNSKTFEEEQKTERCKMYIDIAKQCLDSINKEATFIYDVARRSKMNEHINESFVDNIYALVKATDRYQRTIKIMFEYDYQNDNKDINSFVFTSLGYEDDAKAFGGAIAAIFEDFTI